MITLLLILIITGLLLMVFGAGFIVLLDPIIAIAVIILIVKLVKRIKSGKKK